MSENTASSLPAAIMHYFGKKPNQTTAEFLAELKALTDQDRADLREMLKAEGYPLAGNMGETR